MKTTNETDNQTTTQATPLEIPSYHFTAPKQAAVTEFKASLESVHGLLNRDALPLSVLNSLRGTVNLCLRLPRQSEVRDFINKASQAEIVEFLEGITAEVGERAQAAPKPIELADGTKAEIDLIVARLLNGDSVQVTSARDAKRLLAGVKASVAQLITTSEPAPSE